MLENDLRVHGEEQLVPDDRTFEFPAKLIEVIRRIQMAEVVVRIQIRVAEILEELPVKSVGPAPCREVDDRAAKDAVFGRRNARLHFLFRDIGKGSGNIDIGILRLNIQHAVHKVEISLEGEAVH